MTLWHLMKNDFRFQWRHGIHGAYAVVVLLYAITLRLMPVSIRPELLAGLLFSDVTVFGFFFVGGIVLLEKSQGVLTPFFMSPLPPATYLYSKMATMMLNSLFFGTVLILASGVAPFHWGETLLSVLFMSIFFTLTGLAIAMRAPHLNAYFMLSVPVTLLLSAPMGLLALPWIHAWLWLTPVTGGWQIMASGILKQPVMRWPAVLILLLSIFIVWTFTEKWLYRFVIDGGHSR